MHKSAIHPDIVSAVTKRRGRLAVFDDIVPERTAHLVVDLQNGFMAPGQPAEIPQARTIIENVNRISAALRAAGGHVVYLQHTFDDTDLATWSTFFEHFIPKTARQAVAGSFAAGTFGHALWPELDVRPEDLKVPKRRFGAFVHGSSELHDILIARGIDTLIVSGTATHVCCESTARDAMMMNYKVFFVSDATATINDDVQNGTLTALAQTFCDVRDSDSIVALIDANGERRAAAPTERKASRR